MSSVVCDWKEMSALIALNCSDQSHPKHPPFSCEPKIDSWSKTQEPGLGYNLSKLVSRPIECIKIFLLVYASIYEKDICMDS